MTTKISKAVLEEIVSSLESIKGWGTVEICIQNYKVTQITEKNIKKPMFDTTAIQ
jgi:hypothetical protein